MTFHALATRGIVGALVVGAVTACNAIVGVQDVTLREDNGGPGDEDGGGGGSPVRPNVLQMALGEHHTCARKPEGTVRCWGDDVQGQTGSGGPADAGYVTTPRDVGGIDDAIDIVAGRNHTCVARKSGTVSCWGYNLDGQLGNGESGNRKGVPVDVVGITNAFAVAAGGNFSCALRRSGSVACWGANGSGQLGTGDDAPSLTPIAVPELTGVVAIAAGDLHACAVKDTGRVACWGEGGNGQLGEGEPTSSSIPIAVDNLRDAVMVTAAERTTCALTKAGSVACWGANEFGQLGSGAANATPNPTAVVVANLSDAVWIWSGLHHTCALRKSGAVACWGAGSSGQLGDGKSRPQGSETQASAVVVSGLENAISIGAGGNHSCAPTTTDTIMCWGANDRGQLGTGTTTMALAPAEVKGYP